MKVWVIEYSRFDESYVDSVWKTELGARRALDKLSADMRYYSIREMEVKDE